MSGYEVGQPITVWGSNVPMDIRTVARVTARKVVDSNGDEWEARYGRKWGQAGVTWYRGPHISPEKPGDRDLLDAAKARAAARDVAGRLSSAICRRDVDPRSVMHHLEAIGAWLDTLRALAVERAP